MSDISINKVKLIKQGEKLHVSYKETSEDGMSSNVEKTCGNKAHPDLVKAVNGLAPHLAIMTDYITEKRAADKEELEKFVVSGYSIGGKEDDEGIVITGYRKTRSGKTVTLNTPFIKLDSSPETYHLIKHLNTQVGIIESEVEKYLFEGNKAPDVQQKLPFQEENVTKEKVTKMQIVPPVEDDFFIQEEIIPSAAKQIKGSRKKVAQSADAPSGEVEL